MLRALVQIFFRRVEVTGLKNVPSEGGGIIVAWHPNGIVDSTLILTQCPRRVVFGARHGLFRVPVLGWLMRNTGTVPIYRVVDAKKGATVLRRKANAQSIDALAAEVAGGSFSALFPEGVSHDAPHLMELKTGAARLYYRALELLPAGASSPKIIPVGLHYDEKSVFRSNALVAFHPPLDLPDNLRAAPGADEPEDVRRERQRALTAELERVLREVVHATESWELNQQMHRTRKLVRAERAARARRNPGSVHMEERQLGFARVWAAYYQRAATHPEETEGLRRRVAEYDADLQALKIEDHEIGSSPRLASAWLPLSLFLQVALVYVLLPPILIVGYLVNGPTALLLLLIARGTSKAYKDEATVKMLLGALAFPLTWSAAAVLVAIGQINLHASFPAVPEAPVLAGATTFMLAAVGGAVALRYVRLAKETWRSLRVRLTRRLRQRTIERLRSERALLYDAVMATEEGLELPGAVLSDGRVVRSSLVPNMSPGRKRYRTLAPGTKLGPYEITSQLGSGGMGVVYRAHDPSLDRDIAIKVLPEQLAADPDALRRFQREAKAVAALNHPNVVTIHAVEESGGVHFISMELVDGRPLGELIATGPLPLERFLDVMTPLADALIAAHARGITHRDLKPANVMVTDDGRVKVLDFGLAKVVGSGGDLEETRLTQDGLIVGTVPYMSPEQVEGKPVDHRSDIFSLGVVMYEAVTGRQPFFGDSGPALMSAILRDAPPSISDLRADLPASVARLIDRCLEKAPGERYQDAAELRRELKSLRGGADVAPSSIDLPSIAVLPFRNMSADPEQDYFCEGLAEELIDALARLDGLHVAARTSAFQFGGKGHDLRQVGETLNVKTVLEGSVRRAGNRLRVNAQLINVADGYHRWSERYDRTMDDVFELQDEIARSVVERLEVELLNRADAPLVAQPADLSAYHNFLKGRHAARSCTPSGYEHAVGHFEQVLSNQPNYARAWAGIAWVYVMRSMHAQRPDAEGERGGTKGPRL